MSDHDDDGPDARPRYEIPRPEPRPKFILPSVKAGGDYEDVRRRRKEVILEMLADGYSLSRAAAMAGISPTTVSKYREDDEEFDENCKEAIEMGTDALEDVALGRARDGVNKPVFYQGEMVGHVTEYSDTLLIFLLKARRPEKFSERIRNTLENADGSNVEFTFKVDGAKPPEIEQRSREADDADFEVVEK